MVSHEKKTRSRWYSTKTMTDADYTDDLVLLTNTPAQAESLLHNLEQAVRDIRLYMNSDKTEFTCFKQEVAIFTLSGMPLKLLDQFIYLGNNISSTESNVNIDISVVDL